MALLIFPIGMALGWVVRPAARAAWVTIAVGVCALAVLAVLRFMGTEVSPLEALVLVLGTPTSAWLAYRVARWRLARGTSRG